LIIHHSLADFKFEDSSTNLYRLSLSFFFNLKAHALLPYQSSKLGLVVEDVEIVFDAANDRVLAGNRNIRNANLTLMAPSYLHALLRGVLNDHDALLLLTGTLQNEVVSCGFVYANHFFCKSIAATRHLNIPRKLRLTDFTLKLGEVVVLSPTDHLLLHLDPNPLSQALEVHRATRSVTLAGIEQEIVLVVVLVEAYLAVVALDRGVVGELQDVLVEKRLRILQRFFDFCLAVETLTHVVFNPAQFERHARD